MMKKRIPERVAGMDTHKMSAMCQAFLNLLSWVVFSATSFLDYHRIYCPNGDTFQPLKC